MAMSVVYTTVNGQVLSENRGGVVHHFIPDPLGSVVMVRDTSGNTVYEAEYAPYGDVQSETGTNPSGFGYVGTLGYVKDSASSLYVRARYFLTNLGRWLTKDPLWPSEPGYVYAGAEPIGIVDPSGMNTDPCAPGGSNRTKPTNDCKRCGKGCKPVYFTCNPTKKNKKLAVYCDSDKRLGMGCDYQLFCQYNCCNPAPGAVPVRPKLPPPAFSFGSTVCIHGIHGPISRTIDDCGCGQRAGNLPQPNNWMDYEGEDCSNFKDGWRCVCPGNCGSKK